MTRKKKGNLIKISKAVWIAMQYKKTLKKHKQEVNKNGTKNNK